MSLNRDTEADYHLQEAAGVTQQRTGLNPSERGRCTARRPGHLQHGSPDKLDRKEPGSVPCIQVMYRASGGNLTALLTDSLGL